MHLWHSGSSECAKDSFARIPVRPDDGLCKSGPSYPFGCQKGAVLAPIQFFTVWQMVYGRAPGAARVFDGMSYFALRAAA